MQHIPAPEEWRPIPSHEGYYEASDQGRIRSIDRAVPAKDGRTINFRGVVLNPRLTREGRLQVVLSRPGHRPRTATVHRLVLEAFVGPCPPGMECCHWDDNPLNNRLDNLRWDTHSANQHDRVRNGRDHNASKTKCLNGHEFTPENTYRGETGRHCRECSRASQRRRYHEGRTEAQSSGAWKPNLGGECPEGHPYTAENTYTYPDGVKRACRICKRKAGRESQRRRYARDPEAYREYQRAWREGKRRKAA